MKEKPNPILEQIASLILEKDDEVFEQDLLKFNAWIRDARARAQQSEHNN